MNQKNNFNSLTRFILSSFILISFFYIAPVFIDFTKKNYSNKEFANNSKKILAYTLNSKSRNNNKDISEEDVLFDIFSLNDLESDSVRLSASTIKQLFEDTEYNLNDVRTKKLVKPVALTLLPAEIKMIESTKKEKSFLFKLFYL